MKRSRRMRTHRSEMDPNNIGGMHEDWEHDMSVIPETPDGVARSPPTREGLAGTDGPRDDGIPREEPSKHRRAQGNKNEDVDAAGAKEHEAVVRKPQQAQAVPARRKQKTSLSFQATQRNKRNLEASVRRGIIRAAENNTALPQWLQRNKPGHMDDNLISLRAALLAPERDQARVTLMLADLAGPDEQAAGREGAAEVPEPGASGAGRESGAAAAWTTEGTRLPAKEPVGDRL